MRLACESIEMRVLEARFQGGKKGAGERVVVGRVVVRNNVATVEAAQSAGAPGVDLDLEAMLTKLRFLVEQSKPNPVERLLHLKSDFWSFVEICE